MSNLKYNLRCNPAISERITNEDFIYSTRKLPGEKSLLSHCHATSTENTEPSCKRRALKFRCNFCNESLPTLMSLSTHVKSHWRNYCRICYWIFVDGESTGEHMLQHQSD